MLEAAGPRGPALESREGLLPEARVDEARPRDVLPDRRRGQADPRPRAPDGDEALRERDHGGPDLAEAGAEEHPRLAADRDRRVPVRPHRRGARGQRRGAPRVGGQPRRDRLQPVAGAARRPRPSRRAARRPRPDARDRLGRGAADGDGRERGADRARPARLPEDVRLQGHPHQRPDHAGLGLPRGPPRRAGAGPRGRAARARPGDEQVVEGGAPRRVRRLQPERARPHRRLVLLGPPHARRARVLRAELGRGARRRAGRPAARHRAGPAARRSATRPPTSTSVPGSLDQLLDLARRDEEGGLGDAPWPPHFPKAKNEPKRVQPSRDADRPTQRGRAGDPQPGGPPPGVRRRPPARLRLQAPHRPGPRARVRRR